MTPTSRGGAGPRKPITARRPGDGGTRQPGTPDRLPYPDALAALYRRLSAGVVAHPVYAMAKMIEWWGQGNEWKLTGPRGTTGVKPYAYEQAMRRLEGLHDLAEQVRARRAAWLAPLEGKGLARRLLLTARTDAVAWLASPGPLELGLALHHVYGFPVLPATSLKGLARRAAGPAAAGRYGSQDSVAPVAILDGLPCLGWRVQRDVMTPHFSGWYQEGRLPDDTEDPKPIPFLSIAAGSRFEVALIARDGNYPVVLKQVMEDLHIGLEERGLGAKTAAGYGVFSVELAPRRQPRPPGESEQPAAEAGKEEVSAVPPARRSPQASAVQARVMALKSQEVRPHLQSIVAQIGRCEPDEQRELVQVLRDRLKQLGLKRKEIENLLGRYPELRHGGEP